MPDGPAFPTAFSLNLPRTLALSRSQVSFALDMLAVRAHERWAGIQEGKEADELKNLLTKLVFYKKALSRNVAPGMRAEAAFVSAASRGISLKD